MAMKQCEKGHLYDDSRSNRCPYCSGESTLGTSISLQGGVNLANVEIGATEALPSVNEINVNDVLPQTTPLQDTKYGATVFLDDEKNSEIKPVRGWLVVVEGKKCGMDFRIHTGQNKIGRSKSNDICFDFDQNISNNNCCSIIYDDRNNSFFLKSGDGTNNIYVNNELLLDPIKIKDNDIIEIGKTKLVFRALCNESFQYGV